MNVFEKILQATDLNIDSQGDGYQHGALFVLLSALSALDHAHPTADAQPNAVQELLEIRLGPFRDNKFVKEFVAPYLNSFVTKV